MTMPEDNQTPASLLPVASNGPHGHCAVGAGSASARPGDRGVWSIGDPSNPTPDDAICGSESMARENAREMSNTRVMAVWSGPDLIALYFERQPWRRA